LVKTILKCAFRTVWNPGFSNYAFKVARPYKCRFYFLPNPGVILSKINKKHFEKFKKCNKFKIVS
jgi:hypothetical protein